MFGFPSPGNASTFTDQWNILFLVLIGLSLLFAVPIFLLLIYFGARYRRGSGATRRMPRFSEVKIELVWIAVPTVLALGVFGWAAHLYVNLYQPPADAMSNRRCRQAVVLGVPASRGAT